MRRFAAWSMLLAGSIIALWPVALFAALVESMQRVGGVPWSWENLAINVRVIAVLIAMFLCGISLIAFAAWRLRARRDRQISN